METRKILIAGAGQAGLQLAHGLLKHNIDNKVNDYEVTLMSLRTPGEIRDGRIMSTQAMFGNSLAIERALGLNFWEKDAPDGTGVALSIAGKDGRDLNWMGRLEKPFQSVDQRVKMAGWLERLWSLTEELRLENNDYMGHIVIHGATVSDLEGLVDRYDLTIVAAGKGELVDMFRRDDDRSTFDSPQRGLAVVYVHGLQRRRDIPDGNPVCINLIPGAGELFTIPACTKSGPCDILFFEGIPGLELDAFSGMRNGQDQLDKFLELMRKFTPWEYERTLDRHGIPGVYLTDHAAWLKGRYAPVVRQPVGRLPGGGIVLGMADVVVANDPITGQGCNNAAHCAKIYQDAIVSHGGKPYDEEFMQKTFDAYWQYAFPVTTWTGAMLQPPPQHVMELLKAGERHPQLRNRFANGFNNPRDFFDWFMDPGKAAIYLAQLASATHCS